MATVLIIICFINIIYNLFTIGCNLPAAISNTWWFIARSFTLIFLGFFIIRAVWPVSHADAYNKLFTSVSCLVGIGLTIMAFV